MFLWRQKGPNDMRTTTSLNYSNPAEAVMTNTTLTQYGMMAEKHWREFLPKMVMKLEAMGKLQQMLLEAEDKTEEELSALRRKLMNQGLTAQQAHDWAWETVREKYIFLTPVNGDIARRTSSETKLTTALGTKIQSAMAPFARNAKTTFNAIRLVRTLEVESRAATQEEKSKLVKYVGWGGIPQIFDPTGGKGWENERQELSTLLTEEEFESARATTLNAHYTSPEVIRGMYAAIQRFGFKHGRILEPACGVGHFIGCMPDDMHSHSTITGVEIDPITARIAKALYPDADIRNQAFEDTKLADAFYDLAVSNVPFGDYKPFDPRLNKFGFPIHDYFFVAGLERVRPGGFIFFITSKGTMDKIDSCAP
jgi:type I restriction-modification system DNA methylase subunit